MSFRDQNQGIREIQEGDLVELRRGIAFIRDDGTWFDGHAGDKALYLGTSNPGIYKILDNEIVHWFLIDGQKVSHVCYYQDLVDMFERIS